jgi:hypothetical protein
MQLAFDDLSAIKHHFGKFEAPEGASYDWDCEIYASRLLPEQKMRSLAEFIAVKDPAALVLKRIKNVLDYIILFRDRWTRARAERLLEALLLALNRDIDAADQVQLIRNQCLDWGLWMQAVHPGRDLLRDECCSLGAELVVCYLTKARS